MGDDLPNSYGYLHKLLDVPNIIIRSTNLDLSIFANPNKVKK